jgi:hypothetical protein
MQLFRIWATLTQRAAHSTMTVKKSTCVSQLPNAISPTTTINIPFGNLMETKQENVLRFFVKNANGIHKGNSWEEWKLLSIQSQKLQIDILSLTETNYNWNSKVQQFASTISQKYTKKLPTFNFVIQVGKQQQLPTRWYCNSSFRQCHWPHRSQDH